MGFLNIAHFSVTNISYDPINYKDIGSHIVRPVKMDSEYWISDIQTRKSWVIGYPKPDFSGFGMGSGIENFGFSGMGFPDIRSGIPELSDFFIN